MMKKRTKWILCLGLASLAAFALGACGTNDSGDDNAYSDLLESGYNVLVRYDPNGGKLSGRDNLYVVDAYKLEDVQKGVVKLLTPDDTKRPQPYNVERAGYFLAGWYAVREPRVNAQGEPLDEYGALCNREVYVYSYDSENTENPYTPMYDEDGNPLVQLVSEYGNPQGYTYSEKWDFSKDKLEVPSDYEYKNGEAVLTLYAAWVPDFTYQVMGRDPHYVCNHCGTAAEGAEEPAYCAVCRGTDFSPEEWSVFATHAYEPRYADHSTLPIPVWNKTTGALDYGDFPKPDTTRDVTFLNVYADSGMSAPLREITCSAVYDEETATVTNGIARYYGEWEEGIWYRIENVHQLIDNAGTSYCYDILADLDFTPYTDPDNDQTKNVYWPAAFTNGTFSGTFRGNGNTISNVTVRQTNPTDSYHGVFGAISASARFENITFANVSFSLEAASTATGSEFGLFAGHLDPEAEFEGVTVNGTFYVGADVYIPRAMFDPETGEFGEPPHIYDVGLFSGNLQIPSGVSYDIRWEAAEGRTVTEGVGGQLTIK